MSDIPFRDLVTKGTVEAGWWDANIPPDSNPNEVVDLLTQLRPNHPSLPMLERIAALYDRAQERGEYAWDVLRCPVCQDTGWIFAPSTRTRPSLTLAAGRADEAVVCPGPTAMGCPWIAWTVEQGHRRAVELRRRKPAERDREGGV